MVNRVIQWFFTINVRWLIELLIDLIGLVVHWLLVAYTFYRTIRGGEKGPKSYSST